MPAVAYQYNFQENELCHLMEIEDFSPNSVITVQFGQEAVFIKDGVPVGESFLEGRHVLDSTVLDSISEYEKGFFGSKSFHVKVYLVNTARDLALNWGVGNFFVEDPVSRRQFRAGAFGGYSIAVGDAKLLIYKVIGQMSANSGKISFTKFDVGGFIDQKFQQIVKSTISRAVRQQKIEILDFQSHLKEIADFARQQIFEDGIFQNYGFSLKNFSISNIGISDEDYEILMADRNDRLNAQKEAEIEFTRGSAEINLERARKQVIGENQAAYMLETQRNVLTAAAQNEATGQGMNLGLGLAYAQTIGQSIGGMMNNMNPQNNPPEPPPQQIQIVCPSCKKTTAPGAFCSFCGSKLKVETKCPSCGATLLTGAVFCNQCGAKVQASTVLCPVCGAENDASASFCNKCGKGLKQE